MTSWFQAAIVIGIFLISGCSDDSPCSDASCSSVDTGTPEDGGEEDLPADPCDGACGAEEVCDTDVGSCVACLVDDDCTDGVCQVDGGDSSGNACVGCIDESDCGGDTPVCGGENTCVGPLPAVSGAQALASQKILYDNFSREAPRGPSKGLYSRRWAEIGTRTESSCTR